MSLSQLINRPVVITYREASDDTDELGNEEPDESAIETVAELQPRQSTEPGNQGEVSESEWIGFFLPADREFLNTASAVWAPDLGEFEFVGSPPTWRNPRTQTDAFIQANLKRTAGADEGTGS